MKLQEEQHQIKLVQDKANQAHTHTHTHIHSHTHSLGRYTQTKIVRTFSNVLLSYWLSSDTDRFGSQ